VKLSDSESKKMEKKIKEYKIKNPRDSKAKVMKSDFQV
jgi:hypothetical protein